MRFLTFVIALGVFTTAAAPAAWAGQPRPQGSPTYRKAKAACLREFAQPTRAQLRACIKAKRGSK